MPPLALLSSAVVVGWAQGRDARAARLSRRVVVLLIVKAVQLGGG